MPNTLQLGPVVVCRDYLLKIAESYREAGGLAMSTVSNKFYGNARFFDRFRAGKCTISIARFEQTIELFKADWPKGVDFPRFPRIHVAPPKRRTVPNSTGKPENRA